MINRGKKLLKLISNKSFEELLMIKWFIEKAQWSEEENVTIYQGVKIKSFDKALAVAKREKNSVNFQCYWYHEVSLRGGW